MCIRPAKGVRQRDEKKACIRTIPIGAVTPLSSGVRFHRSGGIGGILCLAVLAVAACSAGSPAVIVGTAVSGTIATDAGGQGTVAAGVDVPIALSFLDRVDEVSVVLGEQVRKGQPLLTLDWQPLLANVVQLRAHLQRAESDLISVQADVAEGRTPAALVPTVLDQEQTLESQVSVYGQLLAAAQGQSTMVTSPIDGQVLAVNVSAGQVAKPGATLVEIVDYHRITVTAELPVSAQGEVKPGAPARLTFAAVPGLGLRGTVSAVSPGSVNSGTGFQVTVDVRNTFDRRVHPGYRAYAQVPYQSAAGTIVRRMAVLNIGLAPSMFVVAGDVVQLRQVQVGAVDGSDAQITSGIHPGERYVLVGTENLANGERVRITGALGGTSG
jgi:RND family efflux transporter MFP subunit